MINLAKIKHIHFVGIKGVGLANLALLARQKGIKVTGSDVAEVFVTDAVLEENGLSWQTGFSPHHLEDRPDLVIATAAHGGMTNPEVVAAKEQGLPVLTYAQALGAFMKGYEGVSVCGVGGKGSTASLLASILSVAGEDPSYVIGVARVNPLGYGGHYGKGKYFVAEADDYVACPLTDPTPKFMYQSPRMIVVTNIEYDHPDVYADFGATKEAFLRFFRKLPAAGVLVANIDNAGVREVLQKIRPEGSATHPSGPKNLTYGFSGEADYRVGEVTVENSTQVFRVERLGEFQLHLPGRYNVMNATAAAVAAKQLGVDYLTISKGLSVFQGISRRFEFIADINGVALYDDYAHHPQEIGSLLVAVREWLPGRRVVVIFQPHTFSRTKALFAGFAESLARADVILLSKIYASAREVADPAVSSEKLAEAVRERNSQVFSCPEKEDVLATLGKVVKTGDVILTVGAGDIFRWHQDILEVLKLQLKQTRRVCNGTPFGSYGELLVQRDVSLREKTYFRLGGPADFYLEAKTTTEFVAALRWCRQKKMPYFVLGLGANLLVGDKGIRGLVLRLADNLIEVVGSYQAVTTPTAPHKSTHYQTYDTSRYLKFDDLEMAEPPPDTLVRAGAGVSLSYLINWTLDHGLTGLQYFAGIPSSLGGCIYNNVHGGTKLFEQWVQEVVLLDKEGRVATVPQKELEFTYDYSRVQRTKELVLEVVLRLAHGDVTRARQVKDEWLKRKAKVQPQINCSGCIFKNLSETEAKRIGAPVVSAGWVVDLGLGLKGTKIGGVEISQKHANFFVNDGTGKATDVLALIDLVKRKAKEKFGVDLQEEIQRVGEF